MVNTLGVDILKFIDTFDDEMCLVCWMEAPDLVFIPCGHKSVCGESHKIGKFKACVKCRMSILRTATLTKDGLKLAGDEHQYYSTFKSVSFVRWLGAENGVAPKLFFGEIKNSNVKPHIFQGWRDIENRGIFILSWVFKKSLLQFLLHTFSPISQFLP